MEIKSLFNSEDIIGKSVVLNGWIRNHRKQKDFAFIDLNDGTCFKSIQVVYDSTLDNFIEVNKLLVGASITVTGEVVKSTGNQLYEIKASSVLVVGECDETYPIQPKRHTREFLREQAHLRARTNLFNAVFKIRSVASMAIHEYFQKRGYLYFHAPIITASDCEGAGEMFNVTTQNLFDVAKSGKVNYDNDFFGKKAGLTVSGQLEAETYAMAFSKVYTFGPTFRAENSNTKFHACEFWMMEPEIAFCDLPGVMDIMEDMLKNIITYVLDHAKDEMEFCDSFVEKGLLDKLNKLIKSKFTRVTHEEVINILQDAKVDFEFKPMQGEDIAKEHEKYITEYFGGPVFIYNWPKDIKSFYMKQNDDLKTVAAVDLEVPGVGELCGGSQREEDYDKLVKRMDDMGIPKEELSWYLDLRKFGSVPHSGFGLGFERFLMYVTGIDNIRDVISYYRTPNNCDF